jgi:hypothetical protein
MLGFSKTKTEKMVLELETVMMSIEAAYDNGEYDVVHIGRHKQLYILRWLNLHGKWSDERVTKYLEERGLVRSVCDEAYSNEVALKLMVT